MLITQRADGVPMYHAVYQALLRCAVRRFRFMGSQFLLSGRRPSFMYRSETMTRERRSRIWLYRGRDDSCSDGLKDWAR